MKPAIFVIQHDVNPLPPPAPSLMIATPGSAVPPASALHPPPGLPQPNTTCTTFASAQATGCPAFMYAGPCWCLGNVTPPAPRVAALLDPTNASAGLTIYYGGGVGGSGCNVRGTLYKMVCDPTAAVDAGPTRVVEHTPSNCDVTIEWPTRAACVVAPSNGCPAPPKPTADQLVYHRMEVGALISFNMATAAGSQGCGPGAYPPVRCAFFNRSLHSMMPLVPTPARLK
jgi:hypothetical protein